MTADDFRAFRKRLWMTRAQLAEALDLSLDTVNNYEGARGLYQIPRVIELACEALESRLTKRHTMATAESSRNDATPDAAGKGGGLDE